MGVTVKSDTASCNSSACSLNGRGRCPKKWCSCAYSKPFRFQPLSNSSNHDPAVFLLSPRPHHIMTPGSAGAVIECQLLVTLIVLTGVGIFLPFVCFLSCSCGQMSDVAHFELAESDCAAPLDASSMYPAWLGEHQSAIARDDGYLTRCDMG